LRHDAVRDRIAHGLYTASLISAVLGTRLPGPGASIFRKHSLRAGQDRGYGRGRRCRPELIPERFRARLSCTCTVGGETVLDGEALVKVPARRRPAFRGIA
jgi:3-hydroxybutyryl-CoA dehydratase